MVKLAFLACLLADTRHCQEKSIPIYENVPVYFCAGLAASELAKWSDEHPKWYIKSWKCVPFSLTST